MSTQQTFDTGRQRSDAEKNHVTGGEYHRTHLATKKQIDFITSLLKDLAELGRREDARQLYSAYAEQYRAGEFTMEKASNRITELKNLVKMGREAAQEKVEWPAVPTGRYAIDSGTEGQDTAFYRVVVKDNGFPLLWVYSSDEQRAVKNPQAKVTILNNILKQGLWESEIRFGQELHFCARCGRALTRTESREYGMGEKCRSIVA